MLRLMDVAMEAMAVAMADTAVAMADTAVDTDMVVKNFRRFQVVICGDPDCKPILQ
jgi:hypothetical protein